MRKTFAAVAIFAFVGASYSTAALAAPSVAEILSANKAASGGSAWESKITLSTDADYSGQGMTGTTHTLVDLKSGRSEADFKIGPASGANGFDGTNAWQKDTSGTITLQQGGDAIALAINDAYRSSAKWWLADHDGAQIVSNGEKTETGVTYDVLTVTPKGGKAFDAWFSTKTHLLAKTVEQQGSQTVIVTVSDYRSVDGVMLPFLTVIDTGVGAKYLQTVAVTKAQFLGAQPDSAYAPPKLTVTDFSIAGGAAQTQIPIQILNNHLYGEAKVNGKGPYVFIFDTGGAAIVTPPVAKNLGLKMEGTLPLTGAGEGVMEGGFTHVDQLDIGGATVKNQLFVVMPLDSLSTVEGIPMPGMVGYEVFRRFVTRVDYGAKTITLIDPKHFDPSQAGTPVKFVFNEHIPEVTGTFEGLPAKFDIDTGSRSELTLTKPFAEQNGLRAKHPKGVDAVDGWGVGGPSRGYITRGASMTLGSVEVDNVVTSFATQSKGAFSGNDYSGNVGGGILKRFVVTFDYNNQIMYLKPLAGPVADTGTFDRAGLWFNQSPKGFDVVSITPGGPADAATLAIGDVIIAVDGVSTKNIHIYELRERLRNTPPGTAVNFMVTNSSGKKRTVRIVLRDLI